MNENTVTLIFCFLRSLSAIAAIGGAVFLAYHGKEGWGWMVFLALWIGAYTISTE